MSRERFVVHLPVLATDLPGALRFARAITRAVSFLADVDRAETTVSAEDAQGVRHRVFCDRLLPGRRRCPHPADHDGDCGPGPPVVAHHAPPPPPLPAVVRPGSAADPDGLSPGAGRNAG